MVVFLSSAGKLFQACEAAKEIRLFPYVVALIFGTTNVLFLDGRRLRIGVIYGCKPATALLCTAGLVLSKI